MTRGFLNLSQKDGMKDRSNLLGICEEVSASHSTTKSSTDLKALPLKRILGLVCLCIRKPSHKSYWHPIKYISVYDKNR